METNLTDEEFEKLNDNEKKIFHSLEEEMLELNKQVKVLVKKQENKQSMDHWCGGNDIEDLINDTQEVLELCQEYDKENFSEEFRKFITATTKHLQLSITHLNEANLTHKRTIKSQTELVKLCLMIAGAVILFLLIGVFGLAVLIKLFFFVLNM